MEGATQSQHGLIQGLGCSQEAGTGQEVPLMRLSWVEREVGGGIGMVNTCKPMAVSFQCMTKFTTNKKKKRRKKIMRLS